MRLVVLGLLGLIHAFEGAPINAPPAPAPATTARSAVVDTTRLRKSRPKAAPNAATPKAAIPSAKIPAFEKQAQSGLYKIATIRGFPDRNSTARCDQPAATTNHCWTDTAGNTFRYGCLPTEDKVFSESCGTNNEACDPAKCTGKWTWGGDRTDVCYDNGQELYSFTCGSGVRASVKTCAQLGWPAGLGDVKVCANSKVAKGECPRPSTWKAAQAACAAVKARLCTAMEIANDETKGTGCKDDCELAWAQDECTVNGQKGHMGVAGSQKCSKTPGCQINSTPLAVRCCADVEDVSKRPTLPQGFFSAISHDYRTGGCLGAPLASYSCWTDEEGKSQRMACREDDNFVYFQSCGTDSSCRSCKGSWAKVGDKVGVCYGAPEAYQYRYTCPGAGKQ